MATITEDYVSFETAKLLKEKGFDVPDYYCSRVYSDKGTLQGVECVRFNGVKYISAPTLQMAMKWLREVHNIVIGVNVLNENNKGNTDYSNPDRWWYFGEFTDTKGVYKEELQPDPLSNEYSTYEEAAEGAVKYCLEHLI